MAFNSLDMPGIVKGQGSGFGDFLNWVGDTFFGGSHHTNEVNQEIAQQNIEFQKWANEQNIAFQTEQNNITRQREDTAVQRAAADMEAAGLSKTLAAGNPASAQALQAPQVQAPNNSFKMERNLAGMNLANMVSDLVFKAKESKRAQKLNDAQVANIEADTIGKTISNEGLRDRLTAENALTIAQTEQTQILGGYYKAMTEVEETIGRYKSQELQAQIDKLLADKKFIEQQTNTEIWKQLNYRSGIMLNDKQLTLLSHQIANEACKNANIKQEHENLVAEYVYKMLQAEALTHDIDLAGRYDYPVGFYPSSLFGTMAHLGKGLGNAGHSAVEFAKGKYSDLMNGIGNGLSGYFTFLGGKGSDSLQDAGGGLFETLRTILNFNPLTWLLNR